MLPSVISSTPIIVTKTKKLLIIAEGFESRSLSWIEQQSNTVIFEDSIICKYADGRKSKSKELRAAVERRTKNVPLSMKYNRFEPTLFEQKLQEYLCNFSDYDEIYIDITVMSKMLIMIMINKLQNFDNKLHIIYTEPKSWGPTEEQFVSKMDSRKQGTAICLSSIGVGDIVRTPALSSVVMQNNPCVLIAFLSFNEQLVSMLIDEINPEKIVLINQGCLKIPWRQTAIEKIHDTIINEYQTQPGKELFRFELNDYVGVFAKIAEIYRNNWITNRLIISPTGYKLHALSCAIAKICCPDIHIEYPTPDSYLFDGYSSKEVKKIHEIVFSNFQSDIIRVANEYKLNG